MHPLWLGIPIAAARGVRVAQDGLRARRGRKRVRTVAVGCTRAAPLPLLLAAAVGRPLAWHNLLAQPTDRLAEPKAELEVLQEDGHRAGGVEALRDELLETQAELDVSRMEEERLRQAVLELEQKLEMVRPPSAASAAAAATRRSPRHPTSPARRRASKRQRRRAAAPAGAGSRNSSQRFATTDWLTGRGVRCRCRLCGAGAGREQPTGDGSRGLARSGVEEESSKAWSRGVAAGAQRCWACLPTAGAVVGHGFAG